MALLKMTQGRGVLAGVVHDTHAAMANLGRKKAAPEIDDDLERLRALARSADTGDGAISLKGLSREERRRVMLGL